jgi:hypothetical protein
MAELLEYRPELYSPRTKDVTVRVLKLPDAQWTEVWTYRPSYLRLVASSATLLVAPEAAPTQDKYAVQFNSGMAYLSAIGRYFVKHYAGTELEAILYDGGSVGANVPDESVMDQNIVRWGGTAQTGFDFKQYYDSLVLNRSAWTRGRIAVSTAGTPVQGPNLAIPNNFQVLIKSLSSNTGTMYLGESSSNASSANGFPLAPGDFVVLKLTNLNLVWVNSSVNGESVAYAVEQ